MVFQTIASKLAKLDDSPKVNLLWSILVVLGTAAMTIALGVNSLQNSTETSDNLNTLFGEDGGGPPGEFG